MAVCGWSQPHAIHESLLTSPAILTKLPRTAGCLNEPARTGRKSFEIRDRPAIPVENVRRPLFAGLREHMKPGALRLRELAFHPSWKLLAGEALQGTN